MISRPRRVWYRSASLSRFITNISWLSVGEGIGRGLNFVSNTLLARILGTDGYGLFVFVQSLLYYIGLGVDLGTSRYGTKEIAKRRTTDFVPSLIGIRLVGGLVVLMGVLVFIYARRIPYWQQISIIFAIYVLSYPFYTDWVLKGKQKFQHVAIGKIIFFGLFLISIIVVIRKWRDPIYALYMWAIAFVISNMYMGYMYMRAEKSIIFPSFSVREWREHARESMHFAISGAMIALYEYMPIIILKATSFSFSNIGLFYATLRIAVMISGTGFLVMEASYPAFAHIYYNDTDEFARTHKIFVIGMTIFSSAVAAILSVFAPEFVLLLLGDTYKEGVCIFRVLVWLIPLYYTRYVYGSVLGATGNQIYYILVAVAGITTLLIAFFALLSYGLMAMAYALLIANGVIDVVLILIYHRVVLRPVRRERPSL